MVKMMALGPPGTNGHEAALKAKRLLGYDCEIEFGDNHRAIMQSLRDIATDIGVVAIENSTNGYVREVIEYWLPCIMNGQAPPLFSVVGEVEIPINHCLIVRNGIEPGMIKGVISHPQALGQCGKFLDKHNITIKVPSSSTASATKLVAGDGDYACYAAIASPLAAKLYGLRILQENISDPTPYGVNKTRFYVLGKEKPESTGRDWTALLLKVPNIEGALLKVIGPISHNGINMSALHSIPIGELREYAFYVEVEGHESERRVQAALASIANITNDRFIVLGSFPKAVAN